EVSHLAVWRPAPASECSAFEYSATAWPWTAPGRLREQSHWTVPSDLSGPTEIRAIDLAAGPASPMGSEMPSLVPASEPLRWPVVGSAEWSDRVARGQPEPAMADRAHRATAGRSAAAAADQVAALPDRAGFAAAAR